jgi:catechol 2,3-dioxygenase-like lactoylglutathione lyase family enzyme
VPAIRVIGLDHIVLVSADVERSLGFYVDVLGLEPERLAEWRRGEVPFPSVRITPTTIIDLFPLSMASAAPTGGHNLDHLCLVIEPTDLDALAGSGAVDVASGPTDGLFGAQGYARSLYVRDPDGNTVELRSYT